MLTIVTPYYLVSIFKLPWPELARTSPWPPAAARPRWHRFFFSCSSTWPAAAAAAAAAQGLQQAGGRG
jgi:hypothetical protein